MPRQSWFTLAGSVALIAVVAAGGVGRSAARAVGQSPAGASLDLADLPACGPVAGRAVATDSSWSASPSLDASGTLVAWTVGVDRPGAPPLRIELPPESSLSEPRDGRAVVTADDGTESKISVISAAGRCATEVARFDDVVRSAIVRGRDGAVWFHAVDRASRRDLGVWSVRTAGAVPERLVAALGVRDPAVRDVGRVFATALRLSEDGERLAVQSCGERACRTRVIDLASSREWRIEDPAQGPLVAFERTRATFLEPCPDAPCPVQAVLFDPTAALPGTESSR